MTAECRILRTGFDRLLDGSSMFQKCQKSVGFLFSSRYILWNFSIPGYRIWGKGEGITSQGLPLGILFPPIRESYILNRFPSYLGQTVTGSPFLRISSLTHLYIYTHTYTYTHIHIHTYMHTYTYTHTYIYTHTSIHM